MQGAKYFERKCGNSKLLAHGNSKNFKNTYLFVVMLSQAHLYYNQIPQMLHEIKTTFDKINDGPV